MTPDHHRPGGRPTPGTRPSTPGHGTAGENRGGRAALPSGQVEHMEPGEHRPEHGEHKPEHDGHGEHDEHRAEHAGHGRHAGHGDHAARFRDRLWISALLSVPVILYSQMVQMWLGFAPPAFPGSGWTAPVLGTLVFAYGGWPFLKGGLEEISGRAPGMMLLISLAITVAFGASAATALGYFRLDFWWELALLIDIMLLGHWLEMRALGQASSALDALAALLPDEAERVTGDGTLTVPTASLRPGDVVLVRPGSRVPADGVIIEGAAEFDESMLTGESRPVPKADGAGVVAGTVALDSAVRVRVGAVGEETALAGIRRLVEQAQSSRSRAQALADRAAALLFYVATAAGALTFVAWLTLGDPRSAVERTVTVLVIACPHALGLAIPLVIAISTAMSAQARHPDQGPDGPGTHAHRRRGVLRQDRHADEGRAAGHRGPRGRRRRGRPLLRTGRRGRGGQRAPARPRDHRRRPHPRGCAQGHRIPFHDRAWRPGDRRGAHRGRGRPGPAARARPATNRTPARRRSAVPPCCTWSWTAASRGRRP